MVEVNQMANGIADLAIASIKTDGGTQSRTGLNKQTLADYTELWVSGVELPPVIVFFDGDNYWLADGFHRVESAKQADKTTIKTDVRQGNRRDAVLFSVGANATHGLPRTNADKRRAVETLLRDEEWSQWSDREIARQCHVNDKTVGKIRAELSAEFPQIQNVTRRTVVRNGTVYTQKVKNNSSQTQQQNQSSELSEENSSQSDELLERNLYFHHVYAVWANNLPEMPGHLLAASLKAIAETIAKRASLLDSDTLERIQAAAAQLSEVAKKHAARQRQLQ